MSGIAKIAGRGWKREKSVIVDASGAVIIPADAVPIVTTIPAIAVASDAVPILVSVAPIVITPPAHAQVPAIYADRIHVLYAANAKGIFVLAPAMMTKVISNCPKSKKDQRFLIPVQACCSVA